MIENSKLYFILLKEIKFMKKTILSLHYLKSKDLIFTIIILNFILNNL